MSATVSAFGHRGTTSSVKTEIVRELVNASDGAGLHFDGAAGNIDIASPPDLGTAFSFEFVIKTDAFGTFQQNFVDFGTGGRFVIASNSSMSWNLGIYDQTSWKSFGVKVLDDLKVHHLVVTVDGTSAVLYDNGNQVATVTISSGHAIDSCTDAKIGSAFNGSGDFVQGTYYRARFYNRTLSADDVRTAFERADVDYSSQYGSQTELVTNGDFASATGWSKGDVTVVGDGTAVWAASGNYQYLRRSDWSITKGKKYRITVVTSAHTTNGTLNVMGYTGSPSIATTDLNGDAFTISGTGTHIFEFEALADSSGGVLFGSYPTGAAYVGTMTDISCVQIGCVSDYDLAFAQPALSTLIQDRSNAADGVASSSGVTQVQPITQLNSTSARIGSTQLAAGTSPYIPADGDIIADKVGVGIAPAAPLHAKVAASTGTSPLEVARLEVKDEGVNMAAGMGPKLTFYTPHTDASFEGASIAAKKENADDFNEATTLAFSTCPDAGTNTERLTIDSTGNVLVGAPVLDANVGAKKMQLEGSASTSVGPEMLLHNSGQGGGAASLLTFGGKASGTEGYTAAIKATNTGTLTIGTAHASGGFSEPAAVLTISSTGLATFTRDAGSVIIANRTTDNGDAITIRKNNYDRLRLGTEGITFNNGGNAPTAAAANQLDYYEEGTWTPVVGSIYGGMTAGASSSYTGNYTRIGSIVHCVVNIFFDDSGTSVATDNRFQVTGLPFVPASASYTGVGSAFIYSSYGGGNNAVGVVAISSGGAAGSSICYITHVDGSLTYANVLRAEFTYEV